MATTRISAALRRPKRIATSLPELRYLVFQGMKGEKGDPAKLVGTLQPDGTLYVSNLYSYDDLEEATF